MLVLKLDLEENGDGSILWFMRDLHEDVEFELTLYQCRTLVETIQSVIFIEQQLHWKRSSRTLLHKRS